VERIRVANDDSGHVALPKLYGAPAYARPPAQPIQPVERPFDPDELPLEAARTEEERALARELVGQPYPGTASSQPVAGHEHGNGNRSAGLRGRAFRLRSLTDRIRDPRGDANT
jgi:hypothetical protein